VGEVSMKLSNFLGKNILKHIYGLTKSLIELQEIVSKESQVYRGWASIDIWS
ncbi:bacteriocin immunity protein, partial [Enterococcus faecium]|nr:bacteriocin immunity protein [Enterococcus faecium]